VTALQEFKRGGGVLLAAVLGVGCGISALAIYDLGLFVVDLKKVIGLSRGDFGAGILIMTATLSCATPLAGLAIDRYGPKWPCVVGAGCLSLCFLGMATVMSSVPGYFVLMALLGVLGAASSPVGYTRAVASWFDKGRGLAFGVTVAGIGVSSVLAPLAVSYFVQRFGWRAGLVMLAALAAACIPTTLALLRTNPEERSSMAGDRLSSKAAFAAVRKSGLFWLLMLALATMSIGFLGLIVQFVPLLRDGGLSAPQAARYASLMGLSIVGGRLMVGWLADKVHAPWIGAAVCLLGGGACLILFSGQSGLLSVAALTLGLVVGAESDLISFLTARYFPVAVYGRAYSWQYACFALSGGASSVWIGWSRDVAGTYRPALIVIAGLSVVMAGLFLVLPRYSRKASPQAVLPGEDLLAERP
jgi:MFS family permease